VIWTGFRNKTMTTEGAKAYAYALVKPRALYIYNGGDAISTGLYAVQAMAHLKRRKNIQLVWDEVTSRAARSYHWMRKWGVPLDRQAIKTLIWHSNMQREDLKPRLQRYTDGTPFAGCNFDSPEAVSEFIHAPKAKGGLGLPIGKLTEKTGRPSADKEAMEALRGKHDFTDLYLGYTQIDGYIEKGEEFLRSLRDDGRAHPNYLIDGTETGRPSCSNPNFFNLRRAEDCPECAAQKKPSDGCEACGGSGIDAASRRIRDCVAAPPGFYILEVDMSQVELRGMGAAPLSPVGPDPVLTQAYLDGRDVHEYAAEVATERSGFRVTRQMAKPVNFGIGYGMIEQTLAKRLHCSVAIARQVMDAITGSYTGVMADKKFMVEFAREHGYTRGR
jgi:DNA polymerase I-like protein with 3'-5' exonuclease and polymerase domains